MSAHMIDRLRSQLERHFGRRPGSRLGSRSSRRLNGRILFACCGVMLLPALAGTVALPDTPAAYAWAIPVTVADDNGVHGLRLPPAVYLHAQSAELADIRLFDRRGVAVPYALRQPPTDTYTDARELPLRIFPLYRQPGAPVSLATQGDFKLELRTDGDGRLLSVTSGSPPLHTTTPAQAQAPAVETLILDLGIAARATPPVITALRFAPPAGKATYMAQVWLEASDDLRYWRPLGAADLQWLAATDGAILASDVLAFEPAQFRYARLTWRGGTPAIFAGITALSVNQRQAAPAMDNVMLAPAPGRVPGDLVYVAGAGIPAERAGMQFSTPNAVYAAMLGRYHDPVPPASSAPRPERRHRERHHLRDHLHLHRHHSHHPHHSHHSHRTDRDAPIAATPAAPADPFVPIASATFYDITQDGKRKRSGGLQLSPTRQAHWVVRPYSPQAAAMPLSQAPKLQLSWTPATLLFLANGNGPYTLAVGRAGAPGMEHDVGHIAPGYSEKELRMLPQAEAGTARRSAAAAVAPAGYTAAANYAGGIGGPGGGTAGTPGVPPDAGSPPATGIAGGADPAAAAGTVNSAGTARTTGARHTANVQGPARPSARTFSPSDHGLLWGVLLAGVGALAFLTVRLLKQPAANGS